MAAPLVGVSKLEEYKVCTSHKVIVSALGVKRLVCSRVPRPIEMIMNNTVARPIGCVSRKRDSSSVEVQPVKRPRTCCSIEHDETLRSTDIVPATRNCTYTGNHSEEDLRVAEVLLLLYVTTSTGTVHTVQPVHTDCENNDYVLLDISNSRVKPTIRSECDNSETLTCSSGVGSEESSSLESILLDDDDLNYEPIFDSHDTFDDVLPPTVTHVPLHDLYNILDAELVQTRVCNWLLQ